MIPRLAALAALWLVLPGVSEAQPREPIGRFVVDAHGVSTALPTTAGWTPLVPARTVVPSRALGLDVGAHVYVLRFRGGALGVGGTWLTGRATQAPEAVAGTTAPPAQPEVTTRVSILSPQLSLNFGHSLGFSYLSAGLGRANVRSEATPLGAVSFAPRDVSGVKTLNFGGGARWFLNDHVGVGFDVRWYKLSLVPASATHPGAGRASLLAAGVGVSFK